jgi:catecholate siderophore receptor
MSEKSLNETKSRSATPRRSATSSFIRAKSRAPLTSAAVGLASVMFGGVVAAQEADQVTLDPIDVETAKGSPYNPTSLGLTRIPTPILDTPQSITVVPQQLIRDQRVNTLQEALRNVPGITFQAAEGGVQGDAFNIRGFTARNDIYRDGVREPGWYTRDVFSIQNVEVLKGPSSFLFGRGSTGGVINVTTKLPRFTDFTEIEMSGQTSPGARVVIDANRQFGNAAARIVLLGTDVDTAGRDFINTKRFGVAPSFTMQLTEQTTATLSYIYQKDNAVPDYGIPILPGAWFGTNYGQPVPVPKSTFYGRLTPGMSDVEHVDASIATATIQHQFDKDWVVSDSFRFSDVNRFLRARAVQITNPPFSTAAPNLFNAATGGTLLNPIPLGYPLGGTWVANTNDFQNFTHNRLFANQLDLVGHFSTWTLEHTFMSGMEIAYETRNNYRTTFATPISRVNVGDPDPYPQFPGTWPAFSTPTDATARTIGLYASDQVKINQYLELMGGVRFDTYKSWQYTANVYTNGTIVPVGGTPQNPFAVGFTPINLTNDIKFVSWRTGAVGHPTDYSSVYFMYGTSFNPPSEFTTITNGQQDLAPTTNETYEFGGKVDFFDRKLSLNGALFQTTQQNAVEQIFTGPPAVYQLVGTTRVRGAEIGVAGQITEQWSIFGGYTYLDGRLIASSANAAFIGHQIANTPTNSFSLTNTFTILPGLQVGGGVFYTGPRWTNVNYAGYVPGFWRYDLMASYRLDKNVEFQLNILNIADTKNFESVSGGRAVPGVGRTAILTARIHF